MFLLVFLTLMTINSISDGQFWNSSDGILPWESYLQIGHIERPLGLTLNRSSLAHHHFSIGYLCLQSFMYDEAQDAFDLAINNTPTLIEAHIGKILSCKHAVWADTDFECGLGAIKNVSTIITTHSVTLSPLQSSLLTTVHEWYANQSSVEAGEQAFLASIEKVAKTYPSETDIRVLWGLSLLNVAFQRQYEGQLESKPLLESREVLKTALQNEPRHPGALHYLIHAYDVDQVTTVEKATEYAKTYGTLVQTSSHAQHMPAHVWMRTGAWLLAMAADRSGIQASLGLCATKLLKQHVSVPSPDLETLLKQLKTANETLLFLQCDAENRAHSTEWLTYSRLQTGDWPGSVALLRDLFIAENRSLLTPGHYLPFAYRAQARAIVEIFFWFPYTNEFLEKIQELVAFNKAQPIVLFGDNATGWYPIWAEAGYRFAECLQLLTTFHTSNNRSELSSTINDHVARFVVLSNRTLSLSKYIAGNILMMKPQVLGMRAYVQGLWQESLDELYEATQLELTTVSDGNSPTLIFARSSELLATHLLLMYETHRNQTGGNSSSTYLLNGTATSVEKFPSIALDLYKQADQSAPNRAINTLGMARSNAHLDRASVAVNLYQQLSFQMTSANHTGDSFLKEANQYLDQHNSALGTSFSFTFLLLSLLSCIFLWI